MNEGAFEYFIVISAFAVKRNSRILACSPAILDHVANQIIPHCKSHASVLMLMPWTSKTLITDRGPPTFGEGIFPKQVISSVAHMFFFVFLSTADKIFAATDGRPCLPATAAAGAVGGCGGSISHTIHGTYSIFAYMIGWYLWLFMLGKHTNYTSPMVDGSEIRRSPVEGTVVYLPWFTKGFVFRTIQTVVGNGTSSMHIYLHDWLIFMGFHVKVNNYTQSSHGF